MYFPTHYKFYVVRYEYFRVLFVNVFSVYFSVFIFLFVTKTTASLYKAHLYRFNNPTNSIYPYCTTINTSAEDFEICSLSVRGLLNTVKRREIFRWLRLKNFAIYFLQEVRHCMQEKENWWTSEWGFSAIFSSFSSASAETCILFNNNS